MKTLLLGLILSPALLLAQHQIEVDVQKVPASVGKISVAVYKDENAFLKFDQVYLSASVDANIGSTQVVINNVPNGQYAIAVFYDANGNDKLDTNWMGIPKEKVAFSKGRMKAFGPPKFEECVFDVSADTKLSVSL